MAKYLRIALVAILAIAIILSCTVLGNKMTNPKTYSHTIEVLDNNRTTMLGLTAASVAASAAVSALPDDIGSSIAEEISDCTSWFMMLLGFIYLEKYLLTMLGAAACYILFPFGFGALIIDCFFPKATLKSIGIKLVTFGTVMLIAIPGSVWVSDQINATYNESIELTVQSASTVSNSLIGEITNENQESSSVIDEAKTIINTISGSVAKVIDQFKNVLNRFIEATAVMIVTTCLIPVLVVLFFLWVVKTLFHVPIIIPTHAIKPTKIKAAHEEAKEPVSTK